MRKKVEAVYENGVLRPLEPLNLHEHQRITVVVSPVFEEVWLDLDCMPLCALEADDGATIEAVRAALAKIPGSLTSEFSAERDEA